MFAELTKLLSNKKKKREAFWKNFSQKAKGELSTSLQFVPACLLIHHSVSIFSNGIGHDNVYTLKEH